MTSDHCKSVSFLRTAAIAISLWLALTGIASAQRDGQVRALTAKDFKVTRYPVKPAMGNRDVAPAPDGTVWYSNQWSGSVGNLDPKTGESKIYPLGRRSSPHGILMGPDGNLWILDGGQNAVIRLSSSDHKLTVFPLPQEEDADLNTAVFDHSGALWFTGQNGFYGRLDPKTSKVRLWPAPVGFGPYGIAVTPQGAIWFTNFACNYIAKIDPKTYQITVVKMPQQTATGSRRIWSDSKGNLWLATWATGELVRYDPAHKAWTGYKLPGWGPRAYSVYVDENDIVWVSDFMANSVLRFDPSTESFVDLPCIKPVSQVLQMTGRPGQAWGSEQGADVVFVIERK